MTTSKFFGGVRGFAIAGISERARIGFTLLLLFILTSGVRAQENGPAGPQSASRENEEVVALREEVPSIDSDDVIGWSEAVFVRGDANSDGNVDLADGMNILSFIFLGDNTPQCLDAADADDDGQLTISDSLAIFGYLFNGGRAPASPSPSGPSYVGSECDEDPTPDRLGCSQASGVCSFEMETRTGSNIPEVTAITYAGLPHTLSATLDNLKHGKKYWIYWKKSSGSMFSWSRKLHVANGTWSQGVIGLMAPNLSLSGAGPADCETEYVVKARRKGVVFMNLWSLPSWATTGSCSPPPPPPPPAEICDNNIDDDLDGSTDCDDSDCAGDPNCQVSPYTELLFED